jgi:hypothetical protein
MARGTGEIEQAVSRTLRDNLDRLQRTTEELNQAVTDMVSACGSARPGNSLPAMLRAQTAAASLAASLEVLSRFVTAALQPELRTPAEAEIVSAAQADAAVIAEPMLGSQPAETPEQLRASDMEAEGGPVAEASSSMADAPAVEPAAQAPEETPTMSDAAPAGGEVPGELPPQVEAFQISSLPAPEQELHRRASRVAKVSMQDIQMLRPEDLRLGREHKDICVRLRDDIEKAHREYDRRFQSILGHPVDYFYDWMVEILGEGNPETLGNYPYPSPVQRR